MPERGALAHATRVRSRETVRQLLGWARAELAGAGCDSPRLDAEVLLAFVLGVGRERLVIDADSAVSPDDAAHLGALVSRRAAREPVAYLTGTKEFRRISLAVDRRVLIPRPETELLVEVGLETPPGTRIADVGTGSGAVALALKDERPDLVVRGFDFDPEALGVARANAERLGLDVEFECADLLEGVGWRPDAVLANLPYVPDGTALAPEIAHYEPPAALFGGPDGLDQVRRLVAGLGDVRLVALEIGPDQAGAVSRLLREAGFGSIARLQDLAGDERVVVGRR